MREAPPSRWGQLLPFRREFLAVPLSRSQVCPSTPTRGVALLLLLLGECTLTDRLHIAVWLHVHVCLCESCDSRWNCLGCAELKMKRSLWICLLVCSTLTGVGMFASPTSNSRFTNTKQSLHHRTVAWQGNSLNFRAMLSLSCGGLLFWQVV